MMNGFNRKMFAALLVSVMIIKSGYGQMCQQSLPSQYSPISDPSITISVQNTFYLYPTFFKSTHCLGPISTIQYQYCYLYARSSGSPDNVFTVFILSDEGSEYKILHSFTEKEDRNCDTVNNTCCKTKLIAVALNVRGELALGFVIPDITKGKGNALYESDTAMSLGFTISSTIIPNTDIGRTIGKIPGDPQQINNRRFSVSFATDSSSLPTDATLALPTETSIRTSSDSVGRAIGGAFGSLLTVITIAVLVLALVLMKRKCKKAEASKAQYNLDHQQPKAEKSEQRREQRETAQRHQHQAIEMKSNDAYVMSQSLQIPTIENVAYSPIQSNSFNPQLNIQHEYEYV